MSYNNTNYGTGIFNLVRACTSSGPGATLSPTSNHNENYDYNDDYNFNTQTEAGRSGTIINDNQRDRYSYEEERDDEEMNRNYYYNSHYKNPYNSTTSHYTANEKNIELHLDTSNIDYGMKQRKRSPKNTIESCYSSSTKTSPSEINFELSRVSKEILQMEPSIHFPVNLFNKEDEEGSSPRSNSSRYSPHENQISSPVSCASSIISSLHHSPQSTNSNNDVIDNTKIQLSPKTNVQILNNKVMIEYDGDESIVWSDDEEEKRGGGRMVIRKRCLVTIIALVAIISMISVSFVTLGNKKTSAKKETYKVVSIDTTVVPSTTPKPSLHPSSVPSNLPTNQPSYAPSISNPPSSSPSSAPSTIETKRINTLTRYISQRFNNINNKALHWILYDDPLHLTIDDAMRMLQRYVLMLVYYNWNGMYWFNNDGYGTSVHECNWHGVVCNDGIITTIDLGDNNVTGDILNLQDILKLKSLSTLKLHHNTLHGSLPSIPNHHHLISLQLNENKITGTMPSSISQLHNLTVLDLHDNTINGSLPATFNTKLEKLILNSNALTNTIPSSSFFYIQELDLSENSLNGTIPFTNTPSSLQILKLNSNELSGTLSSNIKYHPLKIVQLNDNMLSGTVPDALSNLSHLEVLHLHNNQFYGGILSFDVIFTNLKDLIEINLSYNLFNDTLDYDNTVTKGESRIQRIRYHHNRLYGTLPTNIFQLFSDLIEFDLGYNEINGTIPSSSQETKLETLILQNNKLSGTISSLPNNLIWLSVNHNNLSGSIPSFDNFHNLKIVELQVNNFVDDASNGICRKDLQLYSFRADCGMGEDGVVKVECDCCTGCCPDDVNDFC